MTQARHSDRESARSAELGVLAERMQCVGEDEEEEEEEEEKGLVVLGRRNVKG